MLLPLTYGFIVCVAVSYLYIVYFADLPQYNRILMTVWLVFSVMLPLFYVMHQYWPLSTRSTNFLAGLNSVVGIGCLIVSIWSLIFYRNITFGIFYATLTSTVAIVMLVMYLKMSYLFSLIEAFCVVAGMVLSVVGLMGRQRSGLWVVLGLMLLAIEVKIGIAPDASQRFPWYPLLLIPSVYCFGRGIAARGEPLF